MNRWIDQIDETTKRFCQTFGELSNEQLNWKPHPATWSIAQNIDHLIVINETYFPVIDSIRKGTYRAPFISKIGFIVSFVGTTVLKAVQPDRKKKMKTLPIWEPTESTVPEGILERFEAHQSKLKDLIRNSKGLVDKRVVISSPANKNIVYKLETAFEIMVTHEQRHYEQSKEVQQLLGEEAGRNLE